MNTVDVTVVGAGFNGIYTSWRLARDGISVALIDSSDHIGGVLRGKFWNDYWLDSGTHNFDMRTELGKEFYLDILQSKRKFLGGLRLGIDNSPSLDHRLRNARF